MGESFSDRTLSRDEPQRLLDEHLARHGLKHTWQRQVILDAFLEQRGHVTSEALYERVRKEHPQIGAATVYRALKLFVEAGIAHAHTFREGITLYEHENCHHDHLICLGCGEIIEFQNDLIEHEQVRVVKDHGYQLASHRLHLYGFCKACQRAGKAKASVPIPR
jgi:Fur family ferric uptake transcriptional regulator